MLGSVPSSGGAVSNLATGVHPVPPGSGNVISPDGKLLFSWGEPGTSPSQFMLPHNVWVDKYDRIWIPTLAAQRERLGGAAGGEAS
jgi:hypothetical protein